MSDRMDASRRPLTAGPRPGADLPSLSLVTAAVVAGLIVTGVTAAARPGPAPTGARPGGHPASAGGPAAAEGLRLLDRAVWACRQVAFAGAETVAWRGMAGPSTSVVEVWHIPGARPVIRAVRQAPQGANGIHRFSPPWTPDGAQGLDAGGMLGLSQRMVGLLRANYLLVAGGGGRVAGRPARLVTVLRPGGGLAARLWLDRASSLPLRRQMFGPGGHLVSDVAFIRIRLGREAVAGRPAPAARPWGHLLTTAQLARLRARGWPLPGPLPGHLALLGARQAMTGSGPVIGLDYSDGLSVVSVFVQRGHLPSAMTGWVKTALRGRPVYADDSDGHSVAWSAEGHVYTVVAEAPPQTVGWVVAALPHDTPPGLLARLQRGLRRLVSWLP